MLDLSDYVNVSQAAQVLTVHEETVRRLLRQGKLPGSKVGTLWLIAQEDLDRFKTTYEPRTGPRKRARKDENEYDDDPTD